MKREFTKKKRQNRKAQRQYSPSIYYPSNKIIPRGNQQPPFPPQPKPSLPPRGRRAIHRPVAESHARQPVSGSNPQCPWQQDSPLFLVDDCPRDHRVLHGKPHRLPNGRCATHHGEDLEGDDEVRFSVKCGLGGRLAVLRYVRCSWAVAFLCLCA